MVFVVWLLFFDKTNILSWLKERSKMRSMVRQKEYYEQEIRSITVQLEQLNTSNASLEKFAREQYYMKKEGEEIFLIED